MLSCNRRRAMRRVAQDACARSSGDRAAAFQAAGRGFESLRARHGFRNISTSSSRGPARGSPGTGGAAPRGPGRSSRAAALPPARPGALPAGAELSTRQSSELRRDGRPPRNLLRLLAVGWVVAALVAAALPAQSTPADLEIARQALAVVETHHWNPHLDGPALIRAGVEGLRRELALAGIDGRSLEPIPAGLDANQSLTAFGDRLDAAVRLADGRVSDRQLLYAGLRTMLKAVGGSHTAFLTPEQRAVFQAILSGRSYSGIGVSFARRHGQWVFSSIVPGSPAELAGFQRGDVLLAVDGHGTDDLVSSEVQLLLIGAPGTTVHVTVRRGAEVFTVALVRASIHRPVVRSQMLPGGIGYLKLYGYPDGSAGAIREALSGLLQARPRALIVDLRENGGGLVREFLATISLFLPPGTVVFREIRRDGIPRVGRTAGETIVPSALPLVALIDLGTASNGELTAAALRENRGVPLIGERTAGELEYSTLEVLSDGSAVRVAYARIETSRGVTIEGHGYPPDFEVPLDPTSVRDVQLEWAVRWVLEHLGGEAPGWREPAVAGVSSAGPGLLLCDVHVPGHPDEESEGGEVDKSG